MELQQDCGAGRTAAVGHHSGEGAWCRTARVLCSGELPRAHHAKLQQGVLQYTEVQGLAVGAAAGHDIDDSGVLQQGGSSA